MKENNQKKKHKNGKFIVLGVLLVAVSFLVAVALTPSYSVNTETYDVGTNGIGDLVMTWLEGDQAYAGHLDDNGVLQFTPVQNNIYDADTNTGGGVHATYQIVFNMGGSQTAAPGTVQIKLPRYLFYGRDGLPLTDQVIDIPLVEYPKEEGTGFNYRFETGADGVDYIILENFASLPPSYSFVASFTWILKEPATVANGYTKKVKGTVDIDLNKDGIIDLTSTSNEIELKYNSEAKINSVTKSSTTHYDASAGGTTNIYDEWQSTWVDELKPANDGDYVYAITYAYASVQYATQPYRITFTDEVTDNLGGEVIGYCRYASSGTTSSETGDSGDYCFRKTNTSTSNQNTSGSGYHLASKDPLWAEVDSPDSTSEYFRYFYFLVKYPRNKVGTGENFEISDTVTATLETIDGDTDVKTADYSKSFRYVHVEPTVREEPIGVFPERFMSNTKSGYRTVYGGINVLETSEDGHTIGLGYPEYSSYYYNYRFGGYVDDYRLTVDGDPTERESYGKVPWTANFVDDMVIFGNSTAGYELLGPGDYEFISLGIDAYSVYDNQYTTVTEYDKETKTTVKKIGYQNVLINNSDRPPIKIYYKTNGNDWIYHGTIEFDTSTTSKYVFTDTSGNIYEGSSSGYDGTAVPLPKGVTAVRAAVESTYSKINLSVFLRANLINTEHNRNIVAGKNFAYLYNFSTVYSEDSNGNKFSSMDNSKLEANSSYHRNLSSDFKELIEGIDNERYGKVMGHYYEDDYYTRLDAGSSHQNKWVSYINDQSNRQVKANYTAYAVESIDYDNTAVTPEELLTYELIYEQRVGTFYDLLPLGMTVDLDTIQVETFKSSKYSLDISENEAGEGTVIPSSYSFVENWQGSGRTMMIVKAVVPDDINNYYDIAYTTSSSSSNRKRLFTGMTLRFTGIYSWDSFYDYGTNITNTVAYKSGNGRLSNGYKDDATNATSIALREFMSDLDQDGNPEETTIADTVYAQRQMSITYNSASDAAFTKGVKTADMVNYVDGQDGSVVVAGGGYYTYRLRFTTVTSVRNFVLYDVLEDFDDGEHETWKGVLRNIDVSQIANKGVDVKIYYSTKKNMNLYQNDEASIDTPIPEDADLSNEDIWSLEPPQDMADVTAIAIDCSKKTNGEEFVVRPDVSLVALVTMQAPVKNVSALVAKNAKALNAAWWSGSTQSEGEPAHDNFTVFEWTQVGIKDVDIEIAKESHIPSGTKNNPAVTQNGDLLTYDIIVRNTSDWAIHNNVKIRDVLPPEVRPILEDVAYYYEGEGSFDNSSLVSESGVIQMSVDGQTLDFTISQLLSGDTLHILIPVIVNSKESKTIENTATLLEFDDMDYNQKSQTTYHKADLGSLTIKKKVIGGDKKKQFRFKITLIDPTGNKLPAGDRNGEELDPEYSLPSYGTELHDDEDEETENESSSEEDSYYDPLNTTYSGVEFTDGVGYIYLSDGQSKTLSGIASGIQYIVEEDDYSTDGYFMDIKNATGTISNSTNIVVEATNTYFENPNTGAGAKFVIILMILGIIVFVIIRKHKNMILKV